MTDEHKEIILKLLVIRLNNLLFTSTNFEYFN